MTAVAAWRRRLLHQLDGVERLDADAQRAHGGARAVLGHDALQRARLTRIRQQQRRQIVRRLAQVGVAARVHDDKVHVHLARGGLRLLAADAAASGRRRRRGLGRVDGVLQRAPLGLALGEAYRVAVLKAHRRRSPGRRERARLERLAALHAERLDAHHGRAGLDLPTLALEPQLAHLDGHLALEGWGAAPRSTSTPIARGGPLTAAAVARRVIAARAAAPAAASPSQLGALDLNERVERAYGHHALGDRHPRRVLNLEVLRRHLSVVVEELSEVDRCLAERPMALGVAQHKGDVGGILRATQRQTEPLPRARALVEWQKVRPVEADRRHA